jgi:hypothetical protein
MAYFIRQKDKNLGPLTYEQLKQHDITPSTAVWKDGLADWITASQLPELEGLVAKYPPPFTPTDPAGRLEGSFPGPQKTGSKLMSLLRLVAAAVVIVLTGVCLIGLFSKHSSGYSYQTPPSSIDLEHAYPSSYLSTAGTYRPNFWQTEEDISGTVSNKALHTNYKDIRIRVNFYSQTKTILGTQDYIVYQYVPYGSTQSFTIKALKPQATASCGWVVTGATYY